MNETSPEFVQARLIKENYLKFKPKISQTMLKGSKQFQKLKKIEQDKCCMRTPVENKQNFQIQEKPLLWLLTASFGTLKIRDKDMKNQLVQINAIHSQLFNFW